MHPKNKQHLNPFKPLIIYKASAGSGKTFNLVVEYITLLLQNPENYKHILAVTFTNKATAEMKSRIMSVLYDLKNGVKNNYWLPLQNQTGLKDAEIQSRAATSLTRILHDYSHFSIETIDSFFQRILRNMTRELGIGSAYHLILDDETILDAALEQVIEDMAQDPYLKDWYWETIAQNMEQGKRWNIEKALKNFAKNLSKETFKTKEEQVSTFLTKKNLKNLQQHLTGFTGNIENDFKTTANRFQEILEENHLTINDLARKESGVAGFFKKLKHPDSFCENMLEKTKTYQEALTDVSKWLTKENQVKYGSVVEEHLLEFYNESVAFWQARYRAYNTAKLALKHLYLLGLLSDIARQRQNILKEKNAFLLSDTANLLAKIIQSEAHFDVSFIYEKTGARYDYIMIDEFQDTSHLNWENFKILLSESLDNHKQSIIVGDSKQSIYRWNNGDWRIFESLKNGFNTRYKSYRKETELKSLQVNYRTCKTIVDFNNQLFTEGLQAIFPNSEIREIYADAAQESRKEGGTVRAVFYEKEVLETHPDWNISALIQEISRLRTAGFAFKDMAIICRKNKEIKALAQYFTEQKIQIPETQEIISTISDEAFMYQSSKAIRTIINALKYLENPQNTAALALVKLGLGKTAQEVFERENSLIWLNAGLLNKSLFDLILYLIKTLELYAQKDETAFLFAFLDDILIFSADYTPNLTSFLSYWEESLAQKTIPLGAQSDSIRLLTIHKSKGLEFPAVILPHCDWELTSSKTAFNTSYLWVDTTFKDKEFNEIELPDEFKSLPVIPAFKEHLKDTFFQNLKETEDLQEQIDHLNLLYVALTRAEQSLSIIGSRSKKQEIKHVGDVICHFVECFKETLISEENNFPYGVTVYFETSDTYKVPIESKTTNGFNPPEAPQSLDFSEKQAEITYAQTQNAENFVKQWINNRDIEQNPNESNPRLNGIVLHRILSEIITVNDIEKAVKQAVLRGDISERSTLPYQLSLKQLLTHPEVQHWFNNSYKVLTEADILTANNNLKGELTVYRPDRVMFSPSETVIVDYKFAENQTIVSKYKKQISNYKTLVQEMGHPNVRAWLWFIGESSGEIIEV